MKNLHLALLVILLLCANTLLGQYHGKPYVVNYNPNQYRLDNQNWSLDINEQGVLYIGNNRGLFEFDGSNWNHYSMSEDIVVRSVETSGDSLVYVGAYEEFGYWKRDHKGRMNYHSLSDTITQPYFHNDEIWRIIEHNDKVYFQSFSTIYVYDGRQLDVIHPDSAVVLLMKARNRLFIHIVEKGLYEIKNDKLHLVPGSKVLADDEIKVILPFRDDQFLVGAATGGLYIFDNKQFKPWDIPASDEIKNAEVNVGLSLGKLKVIGTLVNGIYILNEEGKLREHLNAGNFLSNNTVLSLSSDQKGNIWTGLDRGLNYIALNNLLDFYLNPQRTIGAAYTALLDEQDLYLGTNQGLFHYDFSPAQGFKNPRLIDGTQGQVWDLHKINGEILCGHNSGTFRIKENNIQRISNINGGYDLLEFTRDEKQYLLQSTYSSLVLYQYTPNGWEFVRTLDDFFEPIPNIEMDHLGNIWATHAHKGLFRFRLNQQLDSLVNVKAFTTRHGFPNERNIRMTIIQNRIVFSAGKSFFTYDDLNDTIIPYDKLNRKLDGFDQSRQVIASGKDHYWFLKQGKIGLFRISGQEVNKAFSFDLSRLGLFMISNHPEIIRLKDSLHLICLDRGFAIYDENRVKRNPSSPETLIRKAVAFDKNGNEKPLQVKGEMIPPVINHSLRNLKFTFSCMNHTLFPEYRYKLQGLENSWSRWSQSSEVEYTRLPAGKYTFMIQSKNILGKMSDITRYEITIRPPWYASRWAYMGYLVILMLGSILVRKIFRKRLIKHKRKIEKEENDKRRQEKMLEQQKYMRLQNEKLQAEVSHKSHQLANYTMTILRKNEHLTQLKQELQEQKKELGPRFPNYSYRKLLKLIDKSLSSEEDWKQFEFHFDQAHENFIKRLKKQYPHLTQADLKLCAYLRLNLSSKEIAPLLNISLRGVEVRRYRLRKRLNLNTEENLVEFLLNF
mgnify:FL=1